MAVSIAEPMCPVSARASSPRDPCSRVASAYCALILLAIRKGHRLLKMLLQKQEVFGVAAPVRMQKLHFPPVSGQDVVRRARQRQPQGLNTTWPISPNPVGQLESIMAHHHKRSPQGAQVGADVQTDRCVPDDRHANDQQKIGDREYTI